MQASNSFAIPNRKDRISAAILLNEIIEGKGIDIDAIVRKIPDNPDYTDSTSHRHIFILSDKLPTVYVEKIGDKWFYSPTTVSVLPNLHKQIYPFGANIWAKWFPVEKEETFLKFHPWQWIGGGIILAIFLFCIFLLKYFFRFIFNKILFRKYLDESHNLEKIKLVSTLFSVWVGVKILQLFIPTLFIKSTISVPLIKGISFVAAFIFVVIVYKLVELFMFYARQYAQKTTTEWDDQIVTVAQKFLKFLVIFFGLFFVLNTLDVNFATVIAGLSVGGLALALAAQDTVKNFIASVMIFIDRPFKIGDTISGDNFEGTVQEVGFRSTRIKTANNSIVYIANAKLSEMTIDNKGAKGIKKFKTDIIIPHNTSLFQTDKFLTSIRTILLIYPFTKNATIDVFLTDITTAGLMISISYSYKTFNPREEQKNREFILLQILQLAAILEIPMFEQNQLAAEHKTKVDMNFSETEINKKIELFFANFEQQISLKTK